MPARPTKTALRRAFGGVIRELRVAASLSQEQLSFRAKLHRTYIGDLERALKSPTLDAIDAIARALKVDPAELIGSVYRFREVPPAQVVARRQRVRRTKTDK